MTVVEGWFASNKLDHAPAMSDISLDLVNELKMNIALNSKAFLTETSSGRVGFVGSSTECALLLLLKAWGIDYKEVRTKHEADIVQVLN
jgi:Ca2+-transporting ATPase